MYRIRFLWVMILCLLSRRRSLLDEFQVHFWAIPFVDTDVSRVFTHTYSIWMALGRWHFVFNSEMARAAAKYRWAPITSAEKIEYRRSIKVFSRVTVKTRLIGWSETRFYLEQTYLVSGKICAAAYAEGLLRGDEGPLRPPEVFEKMGINKASPDLPRHIQVWIQSRENP